MTILILSVLLIAFSLFLFETKPGLTPAYAMTAPPGDYIREGNFLNGLISKVSVNGREVKGTFEVLPDGINYGKPLVYDPDRPAQEYNPDNGQYRYIDPISGEPGEDPDGVPEPVKDPDDEPQEHDLENGKDPEGSQEPGEVDDLEDDNQAAKNYYQ